MSTTPDPIDELLVKPPVSVDLQRLIDAHSQAQRAQLAANKAVRKAEQMLLDAQETQHEADMAVETLAVILRAATS